MSRKDPIDSGKRSKPAMIRGFAASEIRKLGRNAGRKIGFNRLRALQDEAWAEPDSAIAKDALELVTHLSPPFLLHHTRRTYAFGAILAARNGFKLDRELFFLAAILHDLGLTKELAETPGSFEWVGAQAAREFCAERGLNTQKADLVYDAIALHTSVGIADKREPEVSMVHYGAGLDLMGLRIDEIPAISLQQVLDAHPRTDFKCCFSKLLDHQVEVKPQSHIAGPMSIGLTDLIQDTLA